jgi:YHS domain-containing protein
MTSMRDPVCGTFVTEVTAHAAAEYQGQRYLFCSRGCKAAFEREPEVCLAGIGLKKTLGPEGIYRWTCQRADAPRDQNPRQNAYR